MPTNPLPGHPLSAQGSNLIGSRLAAMRNLHAKGITKIQMPSKKEQVAEMAKGNLEELKTIDTDSAEKTGYLARFFPSRIFGSSPSQKTSPNKGFNGSPEK